MELTVLDRLERLEDRVAKLEGAVGSPQAHVCDCKPVDAISNLKLEQFQLPPNAPVMHGELGAGTVLFRKPIMYLYNLSGSVMQCTVDFKTTVLVDSVPEVRKDNKIVFNLDSDSYVNSKYRYLYYEIDASEGIPKSSIYTYVRNDKNLYGDLERLAVICGLYGKEAVDFASYWELEVSRYDQPYFKCEILTEAKLDKPFPIEITPQPEYFIRRYIKFMPSEKLGKSQLEGLERRARMGGLRVIEWGGVIADEKKIR